jgi:hypothetical protein
MKYVWANVNIDNILEAIELAKKHGKKAGDSYEAEFLEIMKNKNIKPSGSTELSMDELLKEGASHGQTILGMETNKEGKTQYKIIKKKEEEL